ncbi:ATP-binding protein [Thioclava kandeliae]|uniref:ATP-binding protein n=1 Tax=Thioclava kandeliae TaxID=3070818 RepID=A0ABV1SJH4_9RHOB
MSFINADEARLKSELLSAYYSFPRARVLHAATSWALTDYYSKSAIGQPFEARGIMVTGPSRIGKSTEIRRTLSQLNDGTTLMPDGRPAKIASVILSGSLSWKDLGIHTLRHGLKYPATGRLTQHQVWDRVVLQAKLQGVVGIHYDECQHIFPRSPDGHAKILDCFKSLLKHPEWPLMLILSGVDSLAHHIIREEQLAYLLKPVTFDEIAPGNTADQQELHSLCHAYAAKVDVDLAQTPSREFYQRLSVACAYRWGLAVELIIEAIVLAYQQADRRLTPAIFCHAFTARLGLSPRYSPFSVDDYEILFEKSKVFELWTRQTL